MEREGFSEVQLMAHVLRGGFGLFSLIYIYILLNNLVVF
jgi:hypothetical protein